jgi:hypothetical protein
MKICGTIAVSPDRGFFFFLRARARPLVPSVVVLVVVLDLWPLTGPASLRSKESVRDAALRLRLTRPEEGAWPEGPEAQGFNSELCAQPGRTVKLLNGRTEHRLEAYAMLH